MKCDQGIGLSAYQGKNRENVDIGVRTSTRVQFKSQGGVPIQSYMSYLTTYLQALHATTRYTYSPATCTPSQYCMPVQHYYHSISLSIQQ